MSKLVSIEEVLEKLEGRKREVKAKLWDSLNDDQRMGICKKTLSKRQKFLFNTLECIESVEDLIKEGDWPDLCDNEIIE